MSTDTRTRIAERNIAAADHRKSQWFPSRVVSGTGLVAANTLDRLTGWMRNDRLVFGAASIYGVMRGAIYGGLLAVVTAAFIPALFVLGNTLVLGVAGAGALIYGIRDGQKILEQHIDSDPKLPSDFIARHSGAVGKAPAKNAIHAGGPKTAEDFVARLFAERARKLEHPQARRRG